MNIELNAIKIAWKKTIYDEKEFARVGYKCAMDVTHRSV